MVLVPTPMPSEDGPIVAAVLKSETDHTWVGRILQRDGKYWYQVVNPAGGWCTPESLGCGNDLEKMHQWLALKYF